MDIGIKTLLFNGLIVVAFSILVAGILEKDSGDIYKIGLFSYLVSGAAYFGSIHMGWIISANISGAVLVLLSLVVLISKCGGSGIFSRGSDFYSY